MKRKTFKRILTGLLATAMVVTSLYLPEQQVAAAETETAAEGNELRLWYDEPTSEGTNILSAGSGYDNTSNYWQQQTLPIGNGDMGANIYGEIASEHLTFNEKTLWTGGPSDSREDYLGGNLAEKGQYGAIMAQVQSLFMNGYTSDATSLCGSNLVGAYGETNGYGGYGSYQPWGDIYFDYADITATSASEVENYQRDLDLKTAISTVSFTEDGTDYTREYFISHDDNVLVARLTAEGEAALNLDVRFTSDQGGTAVAEGSTLELCGEVSDNQLQYASYLTVVNEGGTVTASGDKLVVAGASAITVYLSAATDYANVFVNPVDETDIYYYRTGETAEELATRVKVDVDAAVEKGYEAVKADHLTDYQELFNRVSLDLGQTVSEQTTDQLLAAYKAGTATEGEQRQLENMLFQYGRYLTIASSREDSQLPSNLQGVWNCLASPPWSSDYHMNVNLQMNYWPTYSTNLAECATPLVNYIDSLREPGRITAAIYAGVASEENLAALENATTDEEELAILRTIAADEENGFMAHTQNTSFGWTCPGWAFSWGWSPAAVPWILQNCWEYYEYTGDVEYMREYIYPMLKEEAIFYDQTLVEDEDGKLVSAPSYSPEHGPYTAGNTYEQSLVWQLYEDVTTAAEILGVDANLVEQWRENQSRLKGPIEIGDDGQLKEWYEETTLDSMKDQGADPSGHRHLSHMLGLFPGDLVQQNEAWVEAARVSMEYRTDNSTGWGMGQRINTWARLGDGNKAHELIQNLFKGGIYPNLWDAHSPFQIDGNFGMTSGVAEMLVQSNMGYINLLPALPDVWADGNVEGLIARGNFEIDMVWEDTQLVQADITSNNGGTATVKTDNAKYATVYDSEGNVVETTADGNDMISFETVEGETYTLVALTLEAAPQNVTATRVDEATVELAWDANEGYTYNVYRQVESGDVQKIVSGLTETTYTDTTADETLGSIYYQVSAVLDSKESLLSAKVEATRPVVTVATAGMVDDRDSLVQYSGNWGDWSENPNYAGTIKYLQSPVGGETATLTFYGTGIEVWTCTQNDRGYYEITIDDGEPVQVDTYTSTQVRQAVVYTKNDLELGEHTIVVKATGTKNDSSSGAKVELDAFKVLNNTLIAVDEIAVSSISGMTTIAEKNSTLQLEAAITPENAINKTLEWSSSDTSIATVDANGLVTVYEKTGKVTITAATPAAAQAEVVTGSIELSVEFFGDPLEVEETIVEDGQVGEDINDAITWVGSWAKWDYESEHSASTKTESTTVGDYFEYTFTGTGIEVYSQKHPSWASFDIYIDGESQGNYSLYAGSSTPQQLVFSKTDLTDGEHTIKCVVAERSGVTKVNLDFFKVLKTLSVVEVDRAALQAAIQKCDALVEEHYDATKWATLTTALETAVNTVNDAEATQQAIDTAEANLTTAYEDLGEPVIAIPVVAEGTEGKVLLVESTLAILKWDAVEKADSYKIVAVEGDAETVVAEGVTETTYKATGLTSGVTYTFKIYAVNGGGQSENAINISGVTTTDTVAPEAVTNLTVDISAALTIVINWEASTSEDVAGYTVYVDETKYDVASDTTTLTVEESDDTGKVHVVKVIAYDAAGNDSGVVINKFVIGVDKTALPEAITAAETEIAALNAADYTTDSWNAIQEALEKANAALNNEYASQATVDAAIARLQEVINALVPVGNKTELARAIASAEALTESEYTVNSWSAMQEVLTEAKAVNEDGNATQADVDAAKAALEKAVRKLVEAGDKTELAAAIETAEALVAADYTADSWAAMQTALAEAKAVNRNGNVLQAGVDEAKAALNAAVEALVEIKELENKIAAAEALVEADYTTDSWAAMQEVLTEVKAVIETANATQADVDAAKAALEEAVTALVKVGDKTELANAIATAEALKEADYTADSWSAMQTALTSAKTVNDNRDALQADIDAAKEALEAAVTALVKVSTGDNTQNPGDTTPDNGTTTPDNGTTTPDNGTTTPDNGNNTTPGDTTPTVTAPKKGTKLTYKGATYKVTKSDLKKGEVSFAKPKNGEKKVTIPATIKVNGITYKVTSIEKNAFKGNKKVTQITVGKNVKVIGANAFSGCTALKKLKLGNAVTTINASAFAGCSKLTSIIIPKNVKKIGANAFKNCKKLKTITIQSSKLNKSGVAKNAFKGLGKTTKIKVPNAKVKAYKTLFKSKGLSSKVKVTK